MQKITGLHSILSVPWFYNFIQWIFFDLKSKIRTENLSRTNDDDIIYDIGCGTGVSLEYLNRNSTYFGFDISMKYINEAKAKFKSRPNTNFFGYEFNSENTRDLPKCDLVIMIGVMHHISDGELKKIFSNIKKKMKPNSHLLTVDPVFLDSQETISKFLISQDRGKAVRHRNAYENLIKEFFDITVSEVMHQTFPPYDRLIIKARARL